MSKILLFIAVAFVFAGCSSKKYFEPKETFSASSASNSYSDIIIDISRDGATLKSGNYIGKAGKVNIKLGDGYRFLNENSSYVLAGNAEGLLKIIDKNTKIKRQVKFSVPVVSATVQGDTIAYVLNNNTFGLYSISSDKKLAQSRSERTFAINTKAANPMFIDSLAVMPMLDGKLIIVNGQDTENAKVVYISSSKVFNNVLYLSRSDNTMVAATPKKLIALGPEGKKEYSANISDVSIADSYIYLFTKEGAVLKFDTLLNEMQKKKFDFAYFSASAAFNGKVFALDQQGSLIVLNSNLTKHKIYDVGEVGSPVFISGTKLYKDAKVIDLSRLTYE